jgi:hypothetical protein
LSVVALVSLALAGCVTLPTSPPEPGGELITYETAPGPFCGRCDSVKFAAASDGRVWIEEGHWAGRYTDWEVTKRRAHLTAAQFARFRQRLLPYRPSEAARVDGPETCKAFASDSAEIVVVWRGGGPDARLVFDFGCDAETRAAMREALQSAPALLGVASPLAR